MFLATHGHRAPVGDLAFGVVRRYVESLLPASGRKGRQLGSSFGQILVYIQSAVVSSGPFTKVCGLFNRPVFLSTYFCELESFYWSFRY